MKNYGYIIGTIVAFIMSVVAVYGFLTICDENWIRNMFMLIVPLGYLMWYLGNFYGDPDEEIEWYL